jgi:lipoyl(octanoyl) transferase
MDVKRELQIRRLGLLPYGEALEIQRQLVEDRKAGRVPDQLLLLEHPPVITLGVRARNDHSHILASPEMLSAAGVELHEAGRGGDVTYHGPGQLVGYPILDLRPDRCDVHRYVRDLEEVLIVTAATFGVASGRIPGLTGTWVGRDKLAAIGVRISRWITSHGFAFNVSTNLSHFDLIVPCGITDKGVTSVSRLTGTSVPMQRVQDAVIHAIAGVFGRTPVELAERTASSPQP